MGILFCIDDAALGRTVAAALEEAGHQVVPWQPAAAAAADSLIAVVEGLERAGQALEFPGDIVALLTEDELDGLADCAREITDYVVAPASMRELVARVEGILALPPRPVRMQEQALAKAVDAASDIIELTTPDVRLQYVNPSYERTLGYTVDEVVGKTPAQLQRSDQHPPEFFREIDRTLSSGNAWRGTIMSRARGGGLVYLDSTISPIIDRKGNITHHLAVKRDITEQLHKQEALEAANRALAQARDAAVDASRAKSEFLANMSHELRTPLNAIIGYSEMLMEEHDDDEQTMKDLQRVRAAGSHLLALIDDVLDISKIEADRVELTPESFPLGELIEQVSDTARPLAKKNGNQFIVNCPDGDRAIRADRMRLRQVLLNLLSNACKFTDNGEVELAVEWTERSGVPWVEMRVRDSGIGISVEQQSKLFQPFVQADSSTTRKFGGTGLGLVISRRLTEMMGGEVGLQSEQGVGSTFTVALPVEAVAAGAVVAAPGEGPSVLLIDDDPDIRALFSRQLGKRGFRVHLAANGASGIELAERERPDAIVLDVRMPGMSGWEVLSSLKLHEATSSIPVIMLTVMQQEQVGQALGAVDYLIKPLDPERLTATLLRHIRTQSARVLVVEDDEPTRELIRRTLEAAGHTVTEAVNGQDAMDKLARARPELIVLDLMMPVMDGFEFLHRLRAGGEHRNLPVIVATARNLTNAERIDLETMAQRIVEKTGHTRDELMTMISSQIQRLCG